MSHPNNIFSYLINQEYQSFFLFLLKYFLKQGGCRLIRRTTVTFISPVEKLCNYPLLLLVKYFLPVNIQAFLKAICSMYMQTFAVKSVLLSLTLYRDPSSETHIGKDTKELFCSVFISSHGTVGLPLSYRHPLPPRKRKQIN